MDELLNQFSTLIRNNFYLAPVMAFAGGVLTSFTPCSLSNIPLIIGYVGGTGEKSTKRAFYYSLLFTLGTAVTFVILGIIATLAGRLMGHSSRIWYFILGILMILMAIQVLGIFSFIPSVNLIGKSRLRGSIGAVAAGILGGIFSSPCSTPVLIALLAVVGAEGKMAFGIILMFLYAVGHSILVIVAGTSIAFVQKVSGSERYQKVSMVLKIIMALVILALGIYMFSLGI